MVQSEIERFRLESAARVIKQLTVQFRRAFRLRDDFQSEIPDGGVKYICVSISDHFDIGNGAQIIEILKMVSAGNRGTAFREELSVPSCFKVRAEQHAAVPGEIADRTHREEKVGCVPFCQHQPDSLFHDRYSLRIACL